MITTPQEVSLLDVSKSIVMFRQMQVPVIGLVENMSYYAIRGDQNQIYFPFGQGSAELFALENGLFFLGKVPIEEQICRCCDQGKSLFEKGVDAPGATAIVSIAEKVQEQLEAFHLIKGDDLKNFDLRWE